MALTPAEQAARSAGYATPEGTHYISDGDDAIRRNAVRAHQDIAEASYWKPRLTSSANLDMLSDPGMYPMEWMRTASELGIPVAATDNGVLEVSWQGSRSNVTHTFHGRTSGETWQRQSIADVWGEWSRVYAYDYGLIPTGTDLDDLHETAHYSVDRATLAETLTNWPPYLEGHPGHLEVMGAPNGMTVQRTTGYGARHSIWQRAVQSVNTGAWSAWEQVWPLDLSDVSWTKGDVPAGTDLNTLTESGFYGAGRASVLGTLTNIPEDAAPGTLEVLTTSNGITVQRWIYYGVGYGERVRTVLSIQGGTWTDWIDPTTSNDPPAPSGSSPYAANAIRQTRMFYDLGGPIDTGGRGAVAFRIDHGWKNFRDKLLPIFRSAGIVPMVTYNPRDWHRPENEGVTPAEVNQWVTDGWIEISNHGAYHTNATGQESLTDFVANSLAEIEAELPAAAGKVYGFCVPGVTVTGAEPYDGFGNGSTPEQWSTFMGQTILEHHAVGYGYVSGGTHLRILDGTIRHGLSHITLDTQTAAQTTPRIDAAIEQRRGLQLMIHPSLVDTPDSISTAQVQEIVDYIVQKRDAGQLLPLSSYQMMLADSTRGTTPASGIISRNITDLFPEVTRGSITVSRTDSMVTLDFSAVEFADSDTGSQFYLSETLPPGWRPDVFRNFPAMNSTSSVRRFRVDSEGQMLFYSIAPTDRITGTFSYPTSNAAPA